MTRLLLTIHDFRARIMVKLIHIFVSDVQRRPEFQYLPPFTPGFYIQLNSFISRNGYNWHSILKAQTVLNETFVPERYYGYYSAHSVCLPRLFPDLQEDLSWGYSLFLILLNFFAFVFILSSYVYIYRQSFGEKFFVDRPPQTSLLEHYGVKHVYIFYKSLGTNALITI